MKTPRELTGDRIFATIVAILVVGGIAMFASATLGLLARAGASPWHIVVTQVMLGLVPGLLALAVLRFMPPKRLLSLVLPFYILSVLFTLAVFIPHVGVTINGARRWVNLGFTTIQPGEFLKLSVVLMFSAYLASTKGKLKDWKKGLGGFGIIVGLPLLILLAEPNTSTTLIIGATCAALYFLAGAPWRDFAIMALVAVVGLSLLLLTRPYLRSRVETFLHPGNNANTSSYQIQQSLIAIGSGGVTGRGFGQSVQKFNYLPEPQSDSVFAVYGEEFGLVGSILLLAAFAAFALRGFMIAAEAGTAFGAYAAAGLTLLIALSALMNVGAMLGIMPLTGLPLPFVSHGGTALLAALASVGIILNIAAHRTKKRGMA